MPNVRAPGASLRRWIRVAAAIIAARASYLLFPNWSEVQCRSFIVFAPMFLVALLAGCAMGPRYAEVSKSLPPVSNAMARIVFFREAHLSGAPLSPRIKVNGRKVGELPNGSALIVEYAPGELTISVDLVIDRGTLEFPLTAQPGQEYYIEVGLDEPTGYAKMSGGVGGYYLSTLRAEGVTQFCSGWCAQFRDRSEALPKLSDLRVQDTVASPPSFADTEARH
jgi:hypothetical protein